MKTVMKTILYGGGVLVIALACMAGGGAFVLGCTIVGFLIGGISVIKEATKE